MSGEYDETFRKFKREIESLTSETLALQAILVNLAQSLSFISPEHRKAALEAFDNAANFAEAFCLQQGQASGHVTRSLDLIEKLRVLVAGQDQPKHGV